VFKLASISFRAWLLLAFLVILTVGCINPRVPLDMTLEHIPTVAALIWFTIIGVRRPLSNLSYTLLVVFLCFHVLGAHYLYSEVPYEQWTRSLFGRGLNETLGFQRNHYDRLVHFLFGLLCAPVAADIGVRFAGVRPGFWAATFGLGFVAMCGNLYEIIEWIVALLASHTAAEIYNGQQGDYFDAAKDMTLNYLGAATSSVTVWMVDRRGKASAPCRAGTDASIMAKTPARTTGGRAAHAASTLLGPDSHTGKESE
jgi:putative membrane protein